MAEPATQSAAPTVQPCEANPADPTAAKRRCTRSQTSSPPHHRFFQQLPTRSAKLRAHFEKHYPPTSTVCACDLFPVYSSKLHCDAKLPPELAHLCLLCVYSLCSSLGTELLSVLYHWVPHVENEVGTYYCSLYPDSEAEAITAAIPKKVLKANVARTDRCVQQLLDRLGAPAGRA